MVFILIFSVVGIEKSFLDLMKVIIICYRQWKVNIHKAFCGTEMW